MAIITIIDTSELSALDLQAVAQEYHPEGIAYRFTENGSGSVGNILHIPGEGRVGIAWGGTADWADYDDVDAALDAYLHDTETFEARN